MAPTRPPNRQSAEAPHDREVSTEETNFGYIRRTIKPALGTREVRKVCGPLLDNLYARLQKCGDPGDASPASGAVHAPSREATGRTTFGGSERG